MSPVELVAVGSPPDLNQRVAAIIRAAAESRDRDAAIVQAADGITSIINAQAGRPADVTDEHLHTLRSLAGYLGRLADQLQPIARYSVVLPLRSWAASVTDLAQQLAGGAR